MNQINETLMSSFLPQTRGWKLDTPKGYWFIAHMQEGAFTAESNFDDMSQGERIIKQKFNIEVPAYILASSAPGVPVPVKRYVSVPNISFDVGIPDDRQNSAPQADIVTGPFLGADDPTLPLDKKRSPRRDARDPGSSRYFTSGEINPEDPALLAQPRGTSPERYRKVMTRGANGGLMTSYIRIANKNPHTGETVFVPSADLGELSIVAIEE
jgi:hypothetical protein